MNRDCTLFKNKQRTHLDHKIGRQENVSMDDTSEILIPGQITNE